MRLPATILLVLATLCLSGCGPTDEEIGRSILLVALAPHALGAGLMVVLFRLWRQVREGTALDMKPMSIVFGVLFFAALLALVGVTEKGPDHPDASGLAGVLEIALMTMWAFGTSYLALWLITWRIWLVAAPARAFTWSFLPALVLMIWPCPFMVFGVTEQSGAWKCVLEVMAHIWTYPGYAGLVTGPLIILLLIEALIRRKRAVPARNGLKSEPASN